MKPTLHIVLRDAVDAKNRKFRVIPTTVVEFFPPRIITFTALGGDKAQEIRHLRQKFFYQGKSYDFVQVVDAGETHQAFVLKYGYTVIPDRVIVGKKWMDPRGRVYMDSEVVSLDIDTPGPQFAGTVVKVEVSKSPSDDIEEWRVEEVK